MKTVLNSPFDNGEAHLLHEPETCQFRNEQYSYEHFFYRCEQSGEEFTTAEVDDLNTRQVYNQYRERYGIPFEDEISLLKSRYGVSASKLALILGFGENQISNYIDGEVPSKANGKVLKAIQDVTVFEQFVNDCHQLPERNREAILKKIAEIKTEKENPVQRLIFPRNERSIYNGYARQCIVKLKDVILYSLSLLGDTYLTKMNKVLFYIDMLSYKEEGIGITGLVYKSEQYGIIPYRSDQVYALLNIPHRSFFDGEHEMTPFHLDESPTTTSLTENERSIIGRVCAKFRDISSSGISNINHKEEVWKDYLKSNKPIPFNEAFRIGQI